MRRLILGYAPSTIVPAVVAVLAIYSFTRLLSAEAFGSYNLAFSIVMVAQSVLFFPADLALTRFYAKAGGGPGRAAFLKLMYALIAALGAAAMLVAASAAMVLGRGVIERELADTALLLVPLLLLRALVSTNQTVNRAAGRMLRFNLIECLNATLGFGVGLAAVLLGIRSGGAIMAGLAAAALVAAALDVRTVWGLRGAGRIGRAEAAEVVRFIWPLALGFVVTGCLQYADRFIVGSEAGAAALAVYVVSFSLVERPITLLCLSVTAGTFQKAVDTYVADGPEAGRRQAGLNGAVLLGLAVPACIGLIATSKSIAAVMVGPAFRDGVETLVPIMAVTALLRGIGAHYVDHAFHLANRSFRLFMVYTPSAFGNVLLSVLLVPHYGMVAAAYGALACQAAAVLAGWLAARPVLPLWLPASDVAKIGTGALVMTAVLAVAPLPVGWAGLAGGTALGAASYAGMAVATGLGGMRQMPGRVMVRLMGRLLWRVGERSRTPATPAVVQPGPR